MAVCSTNFRGSLDPVLFNREFRGTHYAIGFGLIPDEAREVHNITEKGFNELVDLILKGPDWLTGNLMIELHSGDKIKKKEKLKKFVSNYFILLLKRISSIY